MIAWAYRCVGEDAPTAAALGRATEVGIGAVMPELTGKRPPITDLVDLLTEGSVNHE